MVNYESFAVVEPDIEVIVRSGEHEIAVVGIFQNKSNVWDLVLGVDDTDRIAALVDVFTFVASALPTASFHKVRSAGDYGSGAGGENTVDEEIDDSAQ